MAPQIPLSCAPGWREASPRGAGPDLLVERGGHVLRLRPDLATLCDFGPVGPVDCPLAWDRHARRAYRYVCEGRLTRNDYSCLVEYDIETGRKRLLQALPLNAWVLWLLEWMPARNGRRPGLFGLIATDRTQLDRVQIEHRLFDYDEARQKLHARPLCRDAYHPLAFSMQRREIIFSGAEGVYRVGLKGERIASLPGSDQPLGRGAAYAPDGAARAVLGGGGLFVWDLDSGSCRRLTQLGQYPVWSADGSGIWYSESSSNLHYLDLASGESKAVLSVRRDRYPDLAFSRPPSLSPCGRYLAVAITSKRIAGVAQRPDGSGRRERSFRYDSCFCILDLDTKTFWRCDGFVSACRWLA